jgi:acyl-ACP thioesterase
MVDVFAFPEFPTVGRSFRSDTTVLLSDTGGDGRMRLDAISRVLHDAATLDVEDAGIRPRMIWILRSTQLNILRFPRYLDHIEVDTACSGYGKAWAERRTRLQIDGEIAVEATAIWVSVDDHTGRPKTLDERFFAHYAISANGRHVSARGRLHPPEADPDATFTYPVRRSDLDIMDHVNNAIHLGFVEQCLYDADVRIQPDEEITTRIEYGEAIEYGEPVEADFYADALGHWVVLSQGGRPRSVFLAKPPQA